MYADALFYEPNDIRLGELTEGEDGSSLFDQGVATLVEALELQKPEYQPLDWALTQQNICLAQYQHGGRLGAALPRWCSGPPRPPS